MNWSAEGAAPNLPDPPLSAPQAAPPGDLTIIDLAEPDSAAYVPTGWGRPERLGRWTIGPCATIDLSAWPADATLSIAIMAKAFMHPPEFTSQQVRAELVVAQGEPTPIGAWTVSRRDSFTVHVPPAASPRTLRLLLPNATAPNAFGDSGDVRPLGIYVARLMVRIEARIIPPPPTPLPRVAAVMMGYNERVFLPLWLRHYGAQLGIENCFVIDHGSEDGSTDDLMGANRVRLPRSPYDPAQQTRFNSQVCSALLEFYDWVIYADADELVVVDPLVAPSLRHYCALETRDVVTTIGLNVIHRAHAEPPIDLSRPILSQRPYVFYGSSMCKPLLTRRPVLWQPGCHTADAELQFAPLYLFHLRWFDLDCGLQRLATTRVMPWASDKMGLYQRVADEKMIAHYSQQAHLPVDDDIGFDLQSGPIARFCAEVQASGPDAPRSPYPISLNIWGKRLLRVPERFANLA